MNLDPRRLLHLSIWTYTAFHLVLAALLPLAAHEAHYALYARELQLSYLDHPPLAAWLQSMVLVASSSDFALRLLPIALAVGSMYLLARLARTLYPDRSPWVEAVSVLILQGTLVFHGSMTLSPDAPLVTLALAVMLLTVRVLETDRWRDWIALGLVLGLAGLAKYTAVTLGLSVALALVLQRGPWSLISPRLWLAGALAVVLISPVIWWNLNNDWATVSFHTDYQFEDIQRWSLPAFLLSSAGQVAYYSPLLVLGGVAVLWKLLRGFRTDAGEAWLVPVFVLPVLLAYLLTALESRASPHWSMLGWLLLIPPLACWLIDGWQSHRPLRVLTWISGAYSLLIVVAILVAVTPAGRWPDFRHPIRVAQGWQAAASHGETLRDSLPAGEQTSEPVLLARNWHHAGLLAWYAPQTPVRNLFHDFNPYNFRHGLSDDDTWGVLIYPRGSHEPRLKDLTRDFDCTPIDALPVYFGRSLVQTFHYYACYWHR
jgi:hypothetical protein